MVDFYKNKLNAIQHSETAIKEATMKYGGVNEAKLLLEIETKYAMKPSVKKHIESLRKLDMLERFENEVGEMVLIWKGEKECSLKEKSTSDCVKQIIDESKST